MILIFRGLRCHCEHLSGMGRKPGQNRILAEVYLTVVPLGPWPHLVVTASVPECVTEIDLFGSWKSPHIGSLVYVIRAITVGKVKWKPLKQYPSP